MLSNVLFQPTSHVLEQSFEAMDFLLKLTAITDTQTWLLPFLVNTYSVVPRTPATSRLYAIALDLSRFAELTTDFAVNQRS